MRRLPYIFAVILSVICIKASPQFFKAGSIIKESREALAQENYYRALMLADSVCDNSNNELSIIEALSIAAMANSNLGHLSKADRCYSMTIDLAEENFGSDSEDYINSVFNYAQFLMLTGRYSETLELLDVIKDDVDPRLLAEILSVKASALMFLEKNDEALQLSDKAIEIAETINPDSSLTATLLQNRAFMKLNFRDFQGAIVDFKQALPSLKGKNKGAAMASMALALANIGKYSEAIASIENAIKILAPLGEKNEDYIIALRKKAEIFNLAKQSENATKVMNQFFNLEKNRLKEVLPSLSRRNKLDYWTKEKPLLSKAFLVASSDPDLAMDVALMRRQSTLLASGSPGDIVEKISETHNDIANRLKPNEAAVAFVLYNDVNDNPVNAAITLDSKGNSTFLPLFPQDSLYNIVPSLGFSLFDGITNPEWDYKNALYADTILARKLWLPIIQSLPSDVNTLHFAPEGVFHLWGIENMPFNYGKDLKFIRHSSLNDINNKVSNSLYSESSLIGGGFDFDDLPPSNPYIDEAKHVNREAYQEILRKTGNNGGYSIFPYLPGSRKEADQIATLYSGKGLRYDITEEELKSDANKYTLIHLATHGYTFDPGINTFLINDTDSLGYDMTLWTSGIALSGANVANIIEDREDGILSAREICDIDFSDTDIIILSACQTALGKIFDENASGLVRALKNAGANTIVASLWEVDDSSTVLFMVEFHRALAQGLDKADAFIHAREKTRGHKTETEKRKFSVSALAGRPTGEKIVSNPYSEPYFWAPFIIIDP